MQTEVAGDMQIFRVDAERERFGQRLHFPMEQGVIDVLILKRVALVNKIK